MGTRRSGRKILWRVYISEGIAAQIEIRLADITRNKPEFGARSHLVEDLLTVWLNTQIQKEQANVNNRPTEIAHDSNYPGCYGPDD